MSSGHNDPKLLYAVNGVQAYHIANGKEEPLTSAGPQTLSLLMVPTSSPFADPLNTSDPEEDFYLHLHLPPELDLPLPATTQIYHQPPNSYLIPRWDLGPDSGAFTRIEFPPLGSRKGVQEDVDTFETILAQCTAFLERVPPPPKSTSKGSSSGKKASSIDELPPYNPADYKPGEGYVQGSHSSHPGGRIVLVDEEDGSVVGELSDGFVVAADSAVQPGSKDPVEISFPVDGGHTIAVQPASPEYVQMDMHPAYKQSSLVSNASRASRLIVTTSDMVVMALQNQADSFTKNTKPAAKPVTFTPAAREHIRRINQFSEKAVDLSTATVGQISKLAQNFGAAVARRKDGPAKGEGPAKGYDKDGNPIDSYKPGLLNKSLMAFNTVADGIEQAGRHLLAGTHSSVTTVVSHRWGSEAGEVSRHVAGGFKNVGLVYIDVTGVSRRAILKSVAKGMVVGKVANGGGDLIVGGGDGGSIHIPVDMKDGQSIDTASVVTAYDGNGKKPAGK